MEWNIGTKPKEPGFYLTVVISPNEKEGGEAALEVKELAEIANDGSPEDSHKLAWMMKGESGTGLVWLGDTGNLPEDYVYAWTKTDGLYPELPEGITPMTR